MKTILSLCLILCAALSFGWAADPPSSPKPQLTMEQAKDALLRFIRAHRTLWLGVADSSSRSDESR